LSKAPRTEVVPRPIPPISIPEDLPIWEKRDEIARAIQANPVTIVCGETGSGKTTQLPKICLAIGRGRVKRIGHTQPRRIVFRSFEERFEVELGS
jgi:ATP-dependent helicase HrpA